MIKSIYFEKMGIACSIFCLFILVVSCQKSNVSKPNPNKGEVMFPVNVNITGFTRSVSPMLAANVNNIESNEDSDSLKEIVKYITYSIYSKNGSNTPLFYHSITQTNSDPKFGSISDTLPYGSYQVYVAAYDSISEIRTYAEDIDTAPKINSISPELNLLAGPSWHGNSYNYANSDYFVNDTKTNSFIVDGKTENDITLTLKRIVGSLEVDILDADQNPAVKFSVFILLQDLGVHYSFSGDSAILGQSGISNGAPYDLADIVTNNKLHANFIQKSNGKFYAFQSYTEKPFSIMIAARIGDTYQTKTIENVICYRNQRTIISGNFFGSNGGTINAASFSLAIDPTWLSDSIKINF